MDGLVAQLLRIREEGIDVQEALRTYETEVFARGKKAALKSLGDANAVMKIRDMSKSRQAKQGLGQMIDEGMMVAGIWR